MGTDKATMMIAGKSLWMRQLETLRSMIPDNLLISARTRPAWTPYDIEVVLDEPPSQGPLIGLVAALKVIKTTHLLALAIDLPEMTTEHLQRLWQLASENAGIMPNYGRFYEPLCAIYPVSSALCAKHALAEGNLSLQPLVNNLMEKNLIRGFSIQENERHLYHNINLPKDLNYYTRSLTA